MGRTPTVSRVCRLCPWYPGCVGHAGCVPAIPQLCSYIPDVPVVSAVSRLSRLCPWVGNLAVSQLCAGCVSQSCAGCVPAVSRCVAAVSWLCPDQFMNELPPPTPGHGKLPQKTETQPVTDRFMDEPLTLQTPRHGRPPPRAGTQPVYDFYRIQQADLRDKIVQLQFEIDAVKFTPPGSVTSATWIPPDRPGPAAVPTMKVPKLSWDMKGDDRPDETIDSGIGTL